MKFEIEKLTVKQEGYRSRQGEPYRHQNKLYVWTSGESVLDNLVNRRNRPHTFYKKEIIPVIMAKLQETSPEIFEQLKNVKWGWRQNCGCSMCPCSPGFVATNAMGGYLTIHASVAFSE